jgi:hypothetical protein
VQSGALFRRIRKTKAVEPLSRQAVGHIVKRRAQPMISPWFDDKVQSPLRRPDRPSRDRNARPRRA